MNRRIKISAASLKPGQAFSTGVAAAAIYVAACMNEDYIIAYSKLNKTLGFAVKVGWDDEVYIDWHPCDAEVGDCFVTATGAEYTVCAVVDGVFVTKARVDGVVTTATWVAEELDASLFTHIGVEYVD